MSISRQCIGKTSRLHAVRKTIVSTDVVHFSSRLEGVNSLKLCFSKVFARNEIKSVRKVKVRNKTSEILHVSEIFSQGKYSLV